MCVCVFMCYCVRVFPASREEEIRNTHNCVAFCVLWQVAADEKESATEQASDKHIILPIVILNWQSKSTQFLHKQLA